MGFYGFSHDKSYNWMQPRDYYGVPTGILGATCWLAPETLPAVTDDTPITLWPDLSGNNRHGNQDVAAVAPTYLGNQQNGWPAVKFNGSTQYLRLGRFAGFPVETSQTIFITYKSKGTNKVYHWLSRKPNYDSWPNFGVGASGGNLFFAIDGGTALISSYAGLPATGVICLVLTPTGGSFYINGSNTSNPSFTGDYGRGSTYLLTAGRAGDYNNYYFDGSFLELVFFGRALNSTEINIMHSYLNGKYAIW